MLSFTNFSNTPCGVIAEEGKLTHLAHLEDGMFLDGVDGLNDSIDILNKVAGTLAPARGHTPAPVSVTTKWDGAPAVVAGVDPSNNKFFVATKSAFNPKSPKLNYSVEDIKANYPDSGVADKLIDAFTYLKPMNIKGVFQGDLLYTITGRKEETINGIRYITFRPNTIVYAVPVDSPAGISIKASKIGIVFHTKYTGSSIATMTASPLGNAKVGSTSNAVWSVDPRIPALPKNSPVLMQPPEVKLFMELVKQIKSKGKTLSAFLTNFLSKDPAKYISLYINSTVNAGISTRNVNSFGLYIKTRETKEMDRLKTEKAKAQRQQKLDDMIAYLSAYAKQIDSLFELHSLIAQAKMVMVNKLAMTNVVDTFNITDKGYVKTAPEGFVAVCGDTCKMVKLVDRNHFSRINATSTKEWSK
jgi:hypothetical protein